MNLLLDTHAFLWLDADPGKLSPVAAKACADLNNKLWLSVASVWEMQIKRALGKLRLQYSVRETVLEQQKSNGIQILAVELGHTFELEALPLHHKDPFDRLLIAQAKIQSWAIVSHDSEISKYDVNVIW
jgi:PIN domain nuclease of toxin-antitoxin system